MRRLLTLFALATALAACDDEPPIPSGNLLRPSGLAYVERPSTTVQTGGGAAELRRSDLLVADSEAQGVRIAQFTETLDQGGQIVDAAPFFVPAPVPFFKLAAEAPGFPTEVVVADAGEGPARAYVLAPTRAEIHVLEVDDLPYQAPATAETNYRRGGVPLTSPALEPARLAVDLVWIGSSAERDYLVVAFDGLGAATGSLRLLAVDPLTAEVDDAALSVGVPIGVSDLLYDPIIRRLLVSSTATAAVTEVSLEGTADGGSAGNLAFGATRAIDAGGPTSALVGTRDSGAFALRLDRSAATWLPVRGGRWVRSRDRLSSPFDGRTEAASEPGVLTLREPLPVTGATAPSLGALGFPGVADENVLNRPVDPAGPHDVALIVHEDARALYIVRELGGGSGSEPAGDTAGPSLPRIAVGEDGLSLSTSFPSRFVDGEGVLSVEGCGAIPMCFPGEVPEAYCPAGELIAATGTTAEPFIGNAILRVTPHGPLFTGAGLRFQLVGEVSGSTLSFDAVDVARSSFDDFCLRTGDGVRALLRLDDCSSDGAPVDLQLVGRVVGTGTGEDPRGAAVRSGARLRARVSVVATSTGSAGTILGRCAASLEGLDTLRGLEVHIPNAVEEAAVAEVSSETVQRVFERAPIRYDASGRRAEIPVGFTPGARVPFRAVVRSAELPDAAADLRCALRSELRGSADLGPCLSGLECGLGRACNGADGRCPGACAVDCAGACFAEREARVCERLHVEVASPDVVLDLGIAALVQGRQAERDRSGAVPSDVVYHPQRRSFFVSLPGSRALVEVPTAPGGQLLRVR